MHIIEGYIAQLMSEISKGRVEIPAPLLQKFGEETIQALTKQFQKEEKKFTLRMSNIGRPLCQLKMDKLRGSGSMEPVRALLGDLVEDVVLVMLHLIPEIEVVAELKPVSLDIGGINLKGTLDVVLNVSGVNEVWDIKSASEFAFKKYVNSTFSEFYANDAFGYVDQLFCYAHADQTKPGGWIIVNKSSGEIAVIPVPTDYSRFMDDSLKVVEDKIRSIDTPFERSFKDAPEVFRKKLTGNRVLPLICTFCEHKFACWPGLSVLPQLDSTSKSPTIKYYTYIKDKDVQNDRHDPLPEMQGMVPVSA